MTDATSQTSTGRASTHLYDRLFDRFDFAARVFHAGGFCSLVDFDADPGVGHLHLLRSGEMELLVANGERIRLTEPTLVFFPRPTAHRIRAVAADDADLICASVHVGQDDVDPLLAGLPSLVAVPLREVPETGIIVHAMFEEAFANRTARSAVLDRLSEVVLMQVLRFAIERNLISSGAVAGLADPRLSRVLLAVHESPGTHWTLESMAERAHMSRAGFAAHFVSVVGMTPGDYLTRWRVGVAQGLLSRGRPLKIVAEEVGYASPDSFGRAFAQVTGVTPGRWAAARRGATAAV